ncbi:MAG: cation diffusion facilitator family transporter [Coriobacteriales bacterium]|nr:cation diffusion facilitator family transporter [Coriobacteriales bacterium]
MSKVNSKEKKNKSGEGVITALAAIGGNVVVAIIKFIASAISGSVAMFSEGIHSLVDCGNGILVIIGLKKSQRKPDFLHPFGYGKELYFYSLCVSLLIFLLGGCVSLFQGINAITHETAVDQDSFLINYIVIILAMIVEGTSLAIGLKQFNKQRGHIHPLKFIHNAKDPSVFTVIFEDCAAELGLLITLISTILCQATNNHVFDAIGSICIGVLLCTVAFALLAETKNLLVGEGLLAHEVDKVREIVLNTKYVEDCGQILSMYFGPNALLLAIDVLFNKDADTQEGLIAIYDIERRIKEEFPETTRVFIESDSKFMVSQQQIKEKEWNGKE